MSALPFATSGFIITPKLGVRETGSSSIGPIKLVMRMEVGAAEHLHETQLSTDQIITADAKEGWVHIEATVRDNSQLQWWLRGFGSEVEVLSPTSLLKELRA